MLKAQKKKKFEHKKFAPHAQIILLKKFAFHAQTLCSEKGSFQKGKVSL